MMQLDEHDLQAILEDHNGRMARFGVMDAPDRHALGYNPVCGDRYDVFVRLSEDGQQVEDVHFHGFGCVISRASASMMAESLIGLSPGVAADHIKTVVQVLEGSLADLEGLHADLIALVGVRRYPMRMKCVLLAWNAAREALRSAD